MRFPPLNQHTLSAQWRELAMPYDRARLFAPLADENVHIVSLTVTEKSQCQLDRHARHVSIDDGGSHRALHHPC